MRGVELIEAERMRQINVEGFTRAKDLEYRRGELVKAAECYEGAMNALSPPPSKWPWEVKWFKPRDRIKNLIRAGALYWAEADRLIDRGMRENINSIDACMEKYHLIARAIDLLQATEKPKEVTAFLPLPIYKTLSDLVEICRTRFGISFQSQSDAKDILDRAISLVAKLEVGMESPGSPAAGWEVERIENSIKAADGETAWKPGINPAEKSNDEFEVTDIKPEGEPIPLPPMMAARVKLIDNNLQALNTCDPRMRAGVTENAVRFILSQLKELLTPRFYKIEPTVVSSANAASIKFDNAELEENYRNKPVEVSHEISYERFTDRARKVMGMANQEAQRFNQEFIDPYHVLIGLVLEGSGIGAFTLRNLGVDLIRLRRAVKKIVGDRSIITTIGRLPLGAFTKDLITVAMEEARKLKHNWIGTEHLMLAFAASHPNSSLKILADMGVSSEMINQQVNSLLAAE